MTPEQRAKWKDLQLRKDLHIAELKSIEREIETLLRDVLGEDMYQAYRRDLAAALSEGVKSRESWDEIYAVLDRLS